VQLPRLLQLWRFQHWRCKLYQEPYKLELGEWVDLVTRGYVSKNELLIMEKDAVRVAAARAQPTTEESSVVAGAQPVREPLTDWQIDQIYDTYDEYGPTWIHDFARSIEKQHGITKKGEQ